MVYAPRIILESLNHRSRPPSARCAHFFDSFVIPQVLPLGVASPVAGRSTHRGDPPQVIR